MSETQLSCQDLIVGGGMQGMMAARSCSLGGRDFILIDMSPGIGGILKPVEIDGVMLDPGCHIWGHREASNIRFFEEDLGIRMVPVTGHCEISISEDGHFRKKLAVPSFETLPRESRLLATKLARTVTPEQISVWPLDQICKKAFGADIGNALLRIATKFYGREPSDLSILSARQMAMGRIKLHTCSELEEMIGEDRSLGPLLCSQMLDEKSDSLVKFRYPDKGLGNLLSACLDWIQSRAQSVHFSEMPQSIELGTSGSGGVLRTRDKQIRFKRLMWCCNPLALSTLLGYELPPKESTAGSPFKTLFFRLRNEDQPVEYSHDFRIQSPIFRSWVPPKEMVPDSDSRYVIVECPIKRVGEDVVADIATRLRQIHDLEEDHLEFLGSKPQVRFYPSMTYMKWLMTFVSDQAGKRNGILLPSSPLYGKDVITEWWEEACRIE